MARRGGTSGKASIKASKASKRARSKAARQSQRTRKMAAAGLLGGLLLVPSIVATGPGLGFLPVAAASLGSSPLPVPGDVLRMLAGLDDSSEAEDLGVGGKLPEADTLSPDLLKALSQPSSPGTGAGPLATIPPGPLGIPGILLEAYQRAEQRMAATNPNCGVSWSVLAAIGRIESSHARNGRVDTAGTTVSPILGPQLSGGPGMAAISDSDDGRLDGDTTWDRAVGPMQFIPTTWARYATDGNDDGVATPHNVFDATLAAARYLCAGGEDHRDPVQLARAIFRYNHSETYVRNVLAWASAYAAGVTPLPPEVIAPLPVGPPPPITEPPPATTPPTTTPTPTETTTTPPTSTSEVPSTTTQPTETTPPSTTTTPSTTTETSADTCATTPTTTTETTTPTTTTAPGCPADAPAGAPSEDAATAPSGPTSSLPPT